MARPPKQGLEYFPHDVDMSADRKLKLIEAAHGLIGYAVIMKLLEKIYANGYYLKFDSKEALLFSQETRLTNEEIQVVISTAIDEDFFDESTFKNDQVLTSHGIQLRFEHSTKKRKTEFRERKYWLTDSFGSGNPAADGIKGEISTQRIGKERIGKDIPEIINSPETPPEPSPKNPTYDQILKRFEAIRTEIVNGEPVCKLRKWDIDRIPFLMQMRGPKVLYDIMGEIADSGWHCTTQQLERAIKTGEKPWLKDRAGPATPERPRPPRVQSDPPRKRDAAEEANIRKMLSDLQKRVIPAEEIQQ